MAWCFCLPSQSGTAAEYRLTARTDPAALRTTAARIKPLFQVKQKPRPGDWLAQHREPGQTFDQYLRSRPTRAGDRWTTIYIQPLGDFNKTQQQLVNQTADMVQRFYGMRVRLLEPLGLEVIPDKARRVHPSWGDKQLLTTYILYDVLRPRRPNDAVAVLALTSSDLWPGEGWNFVFGQADLRQRVGVWSLYRNGDPDKSDADYRLCLRRTLKTATHELGHMFGILHCTAYECGMNGSNHRAESDRQPLAFCPECVAKVWWACRVDPVKRYRELVEYSEAHHLDDEGRIWKELLLKLRPADVPR
jgi:archaemetzincin